MGHIWAAYGPHMGTWFATYGAFSTYGEENPSESTTYGQHMGLFFKHRGFFWNICPFWNIWDLSETYGAFRERSLFLFPTCHIALFRYVSFFFLKSFANHKSGLFPIFLPKKKRLLEVPGRAWNLFSTIKAGKPPAKNFKLILRLRFCQFICRRRRPDCGLDLVWFFELPAAAWRARACGSSKCPPRRKDWTRPTTSKLELQLFLSSSSSVFVACMPHRDDDRSTVTLTTRETQ